MLLTSTTPLNYFLLTTCEHVIFHGSHNKVWRPQDRDNAGKQIDQLSIVTWHIMSKGYLWDPIVIEHQNNRVHVLIIFWQLSCKSWKFSKSACVDFPTRLLIWLATDMHLFGTCTCNSTNYNSSKLNMTIFFSKLL